MENPFDKKEIVSDIYENAKKNVKEQIKRQELENIIKSTLAAGVDKDLIGWKKEQFQLYFNEVVCRKRDYYRNSKISLDDFVQHLYDFKSPFFKKKIIIIVDGASKNIRNGFCHLILSRLILNNFYNEGKIGITIPYSFIKFKFNSFEENRKNVLANLLEIPLLYISDVPDRMGFRPNSDGASLMDQLLEMRSSPLILSLSTNVEKFTGHMEYGNAFRDIIEDSKCIPYDGSFFRINLRNDFLINPVDYRNEKFK